MKHVLIICAAAVIAVGCGKKDSGKGGKGGEATANLLENPNKMKLKATKGQKVIYEAETQMETAVITEMGGYTMMFMWPKGGGCDKVNASAALRVAVTFKGLGPDVKKGDKPLPKSVTPAGGVILVKGFNAMLVPMGKPLGTIAIHSGSLKPGTEVTGSVDIALKAANYIRGNFKATVCKKK